MAKPTSTGAMPFADLAADCWREGVDDWEEVDRLEREEPERLPAVIRALAASAPDGALTYIGVQILEDLAELAEEEGRDDIAMDVLLAAQLTPAETFEILAGLYPHYLERWGVRDRFASIFSAAQLDALLDWGGRSGRRLVMDGEGFGLIEASTRWTSDS
jgi:hypothetical protein